MAEELGRSCKFSERNDVESFRAVIRHHLEEDRLACVGGDDRSDQIPTTEDAGSDRIFGVSLKDLRQAPPLRPSLRRGRRSSVQETTRMTSDPAPPVVVDSECELATYRLKVWEKGGIRSSGEEEPGAVGQESGETVDVGAEIAADEVILHVAIYNPDQPRKSQEFLVFGSQYLSELRNAIHCLRHEMINSDHPKSEAGFFFVEDTFYRANEEEEVAVRIAEFLREHKSEWKAHRSRAGNRGSSRSTGRRRLGWKTSEQRRKSAAFHDLVAKAAPSVAYNELNFEWLNTTTFNSLKPRLGYPYVFVHLGTCEHLMVFRDIRQWNASSDPAQKSTYPKQIYRFSPMVRKCTICEIQVSQCVVFGDKYAEESPAFFCNECFQNMHHDNAGELLYTEFAVYPYYYG